MPDNEKVIEEIRALKSSLFEIVNARLDTFEAKILAVFEQHRKEVDSSINELSKRVDRHGQILDEHGVRIKEIEKKHYPFIKFVIAMTIGGLLFVAGNVALTILAFKFIK